MIRLRVANVSVILDARVKRVEIESHADKDDDQRDAFLLATAYTTNSRITNGGILDMIQSKYRRIYVRDALGIFRP